MPRRKLPLELILRAHGTCELLNADDDILWASDADDDFREEFNDEFLNEEDIGGILEFLVDNELLSAEEADRFLNQQWEFSVETLEQSAEGPDDDDGDDDDDYDEG
jgi:hypothetical protein